MPWTYSIAPARIALDGKPMGTGYSGHGIHKNDPGATQLHRAGPIPTGRWLVGPPRDDPHMGPFVLPLTPEVGTETFGRSEFYVHGDSLSHPGEASLGCIILPRALREAIWLSGDHHLEVTT